MNQLLPTDLPKARAHPAGREERTNRLRPVCSLIPPKESPRRSEGLPGLMPESAARPTRTNGLLNRKVDLLGGSAHVHVIVGDSERARGDARSLGREENAHEARFSGFQRGREGA